MAKKKRSLTFTNAQIQSLKDPNIAKKLAEKMKTFTLASEGIKELGQQLVTAEQDKSLEQEKLLQKTNPHNQISLLPEANEKPLPLQGSQFNGRLQRYNYRDDLISGSNWYTPGLPLSPIAPMDNKGRKFSYYLAVNTVAIPKAYEGVPYTTIKQSITAYPIVASLIRQLVQDTCHQDYVVQRSDNKGMRDDECKRIERFLKRPDGELEIDSWLKEIVYDMVAFDSATVYINRTGRSNVGALQIIDGKTIIRIIGSDGRLVTAGDAYLQITNGIPANAYTRNEMYQHIDTQRSDRIYGYSAVEENYWYLYIGMLRNQYIKEFYDGGNSPNLIVTTPEQFTPDQVESMQNIMDTLSGDLSAKRKMRFIPGGTAIQFYQPVEPAFKDDYDDFITKVLANSIGADPSMILSQSSGTASQLQDDDLRRLNVQRLSRRTKVFMDYIIQKILMCDEYEFSFVENKIISPLDRAIFNRDRLAIMTVNEIRHEEGLADSDEFPSRKDLMAQPILNTPGGEGEQPINPQDSNLKSDQQALKSDDQSANSANIKRNMKENTTNKPDISKAKLAARGNRYGGRKHIIASPENIQNATINAMALTKSLNQWKFDIVASYERGYTKKAIPKLTVGILDEVIGKTFISGYLKSGAENLDALQPHISASLALSKNRINTYTNDVVTGIIKTAREKDWGRQRLVKELNNTSLFTKERAERITRYEVLSADMQGATLGYKERGYGFKKWITMEDAKVEVQCMGYQALGMIPIDEYWDDNQSPPAHPNCRCNLEFF